MASKLCCTAEQEGRSDSPELPNARVSQATPAKRPLLPNDASSPNFHNARHSEEDRAGPMRAIRARFSRPSMHSIRSLHKMTSMRSMIRRKFSKDLTKEAPDMIPARREVKHMSVHSEPDTVVRQVKDGPNQQLQITKEDLRKDLLSDKKPDEGGYDSDAEMLDDIAKNIGKKSPSKRPSIHSVDWTASTGR
jgi:hypothetical protein